MVHNIKDPIGHGERGLNLYLHQLRLPKRPRVEPPGRFFFVDMLGRQSQKPLYPFWGVVFQILHELTPKPQYDHQ